MYNPLKQLSLPADFGFPYTPYDIQSKLMRELFLVLERRQIGIFESPTGTGKSLTLTCGALTWLEQHETLVRAELLERIAKTTAELQRQQQNSEQVADWVTAQAAVQEQRCELHDVQKLHELLRQRDQQLADIKERVRRQAHTKAKAKEREAQLLATEKLEVNNELKDDSDSEPAEEETVGSDKDRFRSVQIFYCSRTHTQLAQIVTELRKTRFAATTRCVSLASRKQLCINEQVRRLPNVALMNERCLDMSKAKASAAQPVVKRQKLNKGATAAALSKCCFKSATPLQALSDNALSAVLDIEDLVSEGRQLAACPYYAARAAQADAQLVLLPYQMLLHRSTRQQNGIDIRGAIIIIDEAHNLLDSLSQLHSHEVSLQQLLHARAQITAYKMRYAQRLSTANMLKINQLLYVVRRLVKLLELPAGAQQQQPQSKGDNGSKVETTAMARMLRTYELAAEGDFFNIDLYELLTFCTRTRFAQKLHGFAEQAASDPNPNENKTPTTIIGQAPATTLGLLKSLAEAQQKRVTPKRKLAQLNAETEAAEQLKHASKPVAIVAGAGSSSIRPLLAFLETLTAHADDGRVLITPHADAQRASLKYLLLNPAEHFEDLVRDARALIIAGGTMQPTNELTGQLFRRCPERVQQYFYGHVVPPDAVLPFVVTKGPTGHAFCFNYSQRGSNGMLNELAMLLQNLCNVLPDGVVCFLPSYDYLDMVYAHLQRSGTLARIGQRKQIFRELGSGKTRVEQLLLDYANAIRRPGSGGALLLSVVGGKLSEGLNFADELGRAVIVVGLPYPNRYASELQERMRYLDAQLGTGAGNEYYENLCMKAVNQCIGRSVRHIRDYACVYLLDERYAASRIQQKLPSWISQRIALQPPAFGTVQAQTAKFFKEKRQHEL